MEAEVNSEMAYSWKKYRPSKITFLDKCLRSWTKQWEIREVKFRRGLLGEPITENLLDEFSF